MAPQVASLMTFKILIVSGLFVCVLSVTQTDTPLRRGLRSVLEAGPKCTDQNEDQDQDQSERTKSKTIGARLRLRLQFARLQDQKMFKLMLRVCGD